MRYFLDTEFIEYPCTIDLISIGIVCEDGREFYAENVDADLTRANDFVKKNVIPNLEFQDCSIFSSESRVYGDTDLIAFCIKEFIIYEKPEFWGYYADYDWVAFCWLFGSMIDLPKGWPMYCRDLKQLADSLDKPHFEGPKGEHNALADARWNKEFYEYLNDAKEYR